MNYYDLYTTITKSPKEKYSTRLQELVNKRFDVTTTIQDDIGEEISFGTLEFKKIEARITTIIDPKTGERNSDDFRKIAFKDLTHKPSLGTRYKFEDNIWISYGTSNVKTNTSSLYLRRCNNTINILDDNGLIHREPCYIDYKPTKTGILNYDTMSVPYTKQIVYFQYNDWTKNINVNTRMMFSALDVYKVSDRFSFNRINTLDESSIRLVRCYLDYDNKNEFDIGYFGEEYIGVADYKLPDIIIDSNKIVSTINKEGKINYSIYKNGELFDSEVLFHSKDNNIVVVDEQGNYILKGYGATNIRCSLKKNPLIFTDIPVLVVENIENSYEITIFPEIHYIPINSYQEYKVLELFNGKETDNNINISFSGVPEKDYEASYNNNILKIKTLRTNDNNFLRVNFSTDNVNKIFDIELGGIF